MNFNLYKKLQITKFFFPIYSNFYLKLKAYIKYSKERAVLKGKNFKYRNDDIILVSYPKSGSTWLRFLIANIIKKNTDYKNNSLDFTSCLELFPPISKLGMDNSNPEKLPSPRFLRSHSSFTPYFKNIIYLVRDGRDVMVSYYFHHKKFHDLDCSFIEFLRQGHTKDWYEHTTSWLYKKSNVNLYFIKYEDLLNNTEGELNDLLNYFGIEFTKEELIKTVEFASFQNMRKIEEEKGFGLIESGNKEIKFIRKGEKSSWKDFFGKEEKAIFKNESGYLLNLLGYEKNTAW